MKFMCPMCKKGNRDFIYSMFLKLCVLRELRMKQRIKNNALSACQY